MTSDGIHYDTDLDALVQVLLAADELRTTSVAGGRRLDAVQPGSFFDHAGVRTGDVVVSINEVPVADAASLRVAYADVRKKKVAHVALNRGGQPLTLQYRIRGYAISPPPAPSNPGDASAPHLDAEALALEVERGVHKIDDEHYELKRPLYERLLADPAVVMSSARIVPNRVDGGTRGFKIFGVRPRTILAKVGLVNGDVVTDMNGIALSEPEKVLATFTNAARAPKHTVNFERAGAKKKLFLAVVD